MTVDSFKFLPRLIATFYRMTEREPEYPIPWTPLPRPVSACKFGLVTSAGLYHWGQEPPFDVARERENPKWGDPSYRTIPADVDPAQIGISHLHLNPAPIEKDVNVVLPLQRMKELAANGRIGGLADHHYAFMGYQGFPPDATAWREQYGPDVAAKFKAEAVDCVLLTPA
jgi:D-proline reductase (dithiol) PrdB